MKGLNLDENLNRLIQEIRIGHGNRRRENGRKWKRNRKRRAELTVKG